MKGEIVSVDLSPTRGAIHIVVRIERPVFPKDYTDEKKSSQYLQDVKEWQSIHTGVINFDYPKQV